MYKESVLGKVHHVVMHSLSVSFRSGKRMAEAEWRCYIQATILWNIQWILLHLPYSQTLIFVICGWMLENLFIKC
jgi:hypothetical protein